MTDLRAQLGRRPLCLLVGDDAFRGLTTWHRWQDLFELAHLVVMQRPPLADAPIQRAAARARPAVAGRWAAQRAGAGRAPAGLVWRQALPPLDISATRVRAALRAGRSARFLVTDSCLRYIRRHHLYTD